MITVVDFSLEHIEEIARLEQACFSSPRSALSLSCEVTSPDSRYFTALVNGIVAGYAGFRFALDEGYIDNIAVKSDFRRMGVASALLRRLDKEAEALSLSFLSLEVRESNAAAIRLYESHGYTPAGKRPGFYSRPPEDALIYTKLYPLPPHSERKTI